MLSELANLRLNLVAARSRLRELTDEARVELARAESLAIEAAGGEKALGANTEARGRALTLAVANDTGYQAARRALGAAEVEVERLAAEIEIKLDERRAREWDIREKLVGALAGRGVQVERSNGNGDSPSGFDEAMDAASMSSADELAGVDLPF